MTYIESGREDSNLRPLGPEPSALARLSYAPEPCNDSDRVIERKSVGRQKNRLRTMIHAEPTKKMR